MANIVIITWGLLINLLAYWHRDRWLYVFAGLLDILIVVTYLPEYWYFGILIIAFGVFCFFKAAWDRRK